MREGPVQWQKAEAENRLINEQREERERVVVVSALNNSNMR